MPVTVEEEQVALSPMGKAVKELLAKKAVKMVDRGRVQAIIEACRKEYPTVPGVANADGTPVPMPQVIVTDLVVDKFEKELRGIVEQQFHQTLPIIRQKVQQQRQSDMNGGERVELDTPLVPLAGRLVVDTLGK